MPTGLELREEAAGDEPFLRELFEAVRTDLAILDAAVRGPLLSFQFRAQRESYRRGHPHARFLVVCLDGQPIGNLVYDGDRSIHLIDINLLPAQRSRGLGTALIMALARQGGEITLEVAENNRARHLYSRLGFEVVSRSDVHLRMRRSADSQSEGL